MSLERALVIAQGHPDFSKGGAETAAYRLYHELRNQGMDALFVGRHDGPAHGGTAFSARHDGHDLLFHTQMADFFNFRAADATWVWRDFRDLLQRFAPDVIHFHHYLHLGIELIREARNTCPEAAIVLTLHEYYALCHHNGQMVKPESLQLCYRSSPVDCARCFPSHAPADFFLRERYIKSLFDDVDLFIAPSEFLADRYRRWGLPPERLTVLENGHLHVSAPAPRPLRAGEPRGRFAFFGQLNPYKGIDVMLEAFSSLPDEVREQAHLDIHGANLDWQSESFRQKLESLLTEAEDVASFHGPYDPGELSALMAEIDWVLVPSIWWENSPMVIQEAFAHGRPVICSDIGGMAEKVRHEIDGLHFRVGSPLALAHVVERALSDTGLWDQLREGIRPPPTAREIALEHRAAYESIRASRSR